MTSGEHEALPDKELALAQEQIEALLRYGIPVTTEAPFRSAVALRAIEVDREMPEEDDAWELVREAADLFEASYRARVDAFIEQTNATIAQYPGIAKRGGQAIESAYARYEPNGRAKIYFKTELPPDDQS